MVDLNLEFEKYKVNIPDVEKQIDNIFLPKTERTVDDKINEALEIYGEQRDMNQHEKELYRKMLAKDEVIKENVF